MYGFDNTFHQSRCLQRDELRLIAFKESHTKTRF